jgi:hypothetical protein
MEMASASFLDCGGLMPLCFSGVFVLDTQFADFSVPGEIQGGVNPPQSKTTHIVMNVDGASGAETAKELRMSIAAVYVAKSRVLQRIRELAEGLID